MADIPPWLQAYDRRALKFEEQSADDLSTPARLLMAEAARRLAAEYIRAVGDLTTPVPPAVKDALRRAMRRVLRALATGMISELPALVRGLERIVGRGLRIGAQGMPGGRKVRAPASRQLRDAVRGLSTGVRADLAAADKLARTMDLRRYSDVTTILAKANSAANRVESTARWAANRAVNEGASAVADAAGVARVWIAERDACLTCLAYAGEVAESGEQFPAGLTFGDKSTVTEPIDAPPAHPNCRCRTAPWLGSERPIGVQFPQALQREAQRSVLRGDSDYASRPAKLRAADRLLKTGLSGLPETVKLRARRAVREGPQAFRPAKRTTPPSR